jgi:type VI secretion system protein ImpA
MSDSAAQVDAWLEPLGDPPCGEDLEYDNAFLELSKAAEGKPETQFSEAEPPDWRSVLGQAESLMDQTRDVRVAIYWGRAQLHAEGFAVLPELLRLVREWLSRYWDDVHPKPDPDDGDPYARLNALGQLEDTASLLGDVRQSMIVKSRAIGTLSVRDVEIALDRISPREDESAMSTSSVEQLLAAACEEDSSLADVPRRASEELEGLLSLLEDKAGYGRAPSCDDLKGMLRGLQGLMPKPDEGGDGDDLDDLLSSFDSGDGDSTEVSAAPSRRASGGGNGEILTREDAIKAIERVCEYLERAEPTSPAQLLLRRSQRLIEKNFMDLIRELAPEAYAGVAKIMGVDAGESSSDHSDY